MEAICSASEARDIVEVVSRLSFVEIDDLGKAGFDRKAVKAEEFVPWFMFVKGDEVEELGLRRVAKEVEGLLPRFMFAKMVIFKIIVQKMGSRALEKPFCRPLLRIFVVWKRCQDNLRL
jgi:hypothetical protein